MGEGGALAEADLEGEEAAGAEGVEGLGDEAAVEREAVGAGVEGERGFVVADLGGEGGGVGVGDVGRVGDDGVEGRCFGGQGCEQIAFEEADAGGEAELRGVGAGDGEGGGREIGCGDVGVREILRQSEGDGSGACADVCNMEGI